MSLFSKLFGSSNDDEQNFDVTVEEDADETEENVKTVDDYDTKTVITTDYPRYEYTRTIAEVTFKSGRKKRFYFDKKEERNGVVRLYDFEEEPYLWGNGYRKLYVELDDEHKHLGEFNGGVKISAPAAPRCEADGALLNVELTRSNIESFEVDDTMERFLSPEEWESKEVDLPEPIAEAAVEQFDDIEFADDTEEDDEEE